MAVDENLVAVDLSCAELELLVTDSSPRRELVARIALRDVFDQCAVDKRWQARIDQLVARIPADELTEAHKEAKVAAQRVRAIIAQP